MHTTCAGPSAAANELLSSTTEMLQVRDLLSKNPKNKLELKEHSESGVYVKELNSFVVKSVQEITSVLEVSSRPCAAFCS